jgi:predicted AlkP superfamily phosphohydrolase/phosphomutase
VGRVIVIGWDGATWSVAGPLSDAGRLPTLTALRRGGAEGVLETVPNMNSAPAWSTIATGLNPGRHGIFYFDEPVPGTYRRTVVNAARRTGASLWRMASDAGKRIVVVNVPISYPAEEVNGYLVAGLDTPSKSLPGFTHPADLPGRFGDLFEDYIVEPGAPSLMRAGRVGEARDKLLESVDGWTAVTDRLMDEPWDLVFVVFTSSDTSQHFFWSPELRSTIDRVYEVQDEATGQLVEKARSQDPEVNVIVLADHGGAANTRGPELMPIWLEDRGFQAATRPTLRSRVLSAGFSLANRTLTRDQKQALARRFPKLREEAEAEARLAGIDWARTRAYSDGLRDEVLVNAAGREPEGIVPPTGYGAFVRELQAAVEGIQEAGTGSPVVASVRHREEAYHGPFLDRAPDLTIRWILDEDRSFGGFRCEARRGRERMEQAVTRPPFQPGGHHPEGIVVANGANVRSGAVRGELQDVTPTILALLGVPVPGDLDGRPLGLLKDVRTEVSEGPAVPDAGEATASDSSGYTEEEEEAVRRRLEDMGYI